MVYLDHLLYMWNQSTNHVSTAGHTAEWERPGPARFGLRLGKVHQAPGMLKRLMWRLRLAPAS